MTALQRVRKIAHDVFTFKVLVAFVLGSWVTRLFGEQGHTALPTWTNTIIEVLAIVLLVVVLVLMLQLFRLYREMKRDLKEGS